jgi:diacylglycerol O-acyltransferase
LNNRVAAIFADLPMGVVDPVKRLALVRAEMERLKEHHQVDASKTLASLTDLAPPALLAVGARLFSGLEQHSVQTVTTNVPGPRGQLYAANRKMVAAYPFVPLAGSVRIGVAIFSYAGQVTFGITGDYETASDIDILAAGIDAGITELIAAS